MTPFGRDEVGDLPGLELESVPPPRRGPPSGVVEVVPRGGTPEPAEAPAFEVMPEGPETRLPTVEVAAVAEYGPTPSFLGAIPYAIMVFTRRRELVMAAASAHEQARRAERDLEKSLGALGVAVVEQAGGLGAEFEAMSDDLDAAKKATALVNESRDAEDQAAGRTENERRTIEAELAGVRRELPPHQDRETKLSTQLEVRKVDLGRAVGQLQRAQIELRNGRGADSAGPEGVGVSASNLALLEATCDQRRQAVTAAEQPVHDLEEKLTETRRNISARLARVAQLDHDRKELDHRAKQDAGDRLANEDGAHKNARQALAVLGRRALTAGVAATADAQAARRATVAEEALVRRRHRARITTAAIDAYDKPTLYQGLGVLGAAAIVVLLFVLVVLFRAIF